jgi:hypothetical protein
MKLIRGSMTCSLQEQVYHHYQCHQGQQYDHSATKTRWRNINRRSSIPTVVIVFVVAAFVVVRLQQHPGRYYQVTSFRSSSSSMSTSSRSSTSTSSRKNRMTYATSSVRLSFLPKPLLLSMVQQQQQQQQQQHRVVANVWNAPKRQQQSQQVSLPFVLYSSFTSDGSEYSAADSDFDSDNDEYEDLAAAKLLQDRSNTNGDNNDDDDDENRQVPTIELQPVPISKNAGNRFITVVLDRSIRMQQNQNQNPNVGEYDVWDDHYKRIRCTEDHVMFCRKQNLYNTTFNNHSMVDILWSLPMYVQ